MKKQTWKQVKAFRTRFNRERQRRKSPSPKRKLVVEALQERITLDAFGVVPSDSAYLIETAFIAAEGEGSVPNPGEEQCQNGIDDDGDGKIDSQNDPGCSSGTDNSENSDSPVPDPDPDPTPNPGEEQCQDGVDNDGDGKIDVQNDPGCSSATDNSENSDTGNPNPNPNPDPTVPVSFRMDTNGDGIVTPIDVLLVVNTINGYWNGVPAQGLPALPEPEPTPNRAPVVSNKSESISVGQTYLLNVLTLAYDPDCDPLNPAGFTQPSHGVAVGVGNGIIEYRPNVGFAGVDSFTVSITDGNNTVATSTVTITVVGNGNPNPDPDPDPDPTPNPGEEQCQDGVDNDGDGKVDVQNDPGCSSATDNSENTDSPTPNPDPDPDPDPTPNPGEEQCQDGVDNDGDGKIDVQNDPGCSSATDNSENSDTGNPNPNPDPDPTPGENSEPVVTNGEDRQITVTGSSVEVVILATDADNDPLFYTIVYALPNATVSTTGVVTYQSPGAPGTFTLVVGVSDHKSDIGEVDADIDVYVRLMFNVSGAEGEGSQSLEEFIEDVDSLFAEEEDFLAN